MGAQHEVGVLAAVLAAVLAVCLVLRPASAGLACLSNPCINGVCIDDLNSTYSCYCIDGFTGVHCQTNWDECWSSPCANGGTCLDGIAEYNCTCLDGYVGANCDVNYDECSSDPCQNNGTCVDGENGYACTCLAGYSGTHCELDISVCNSSDEDTRCHNGGRCLDGPGMSFKCLCPSGWQGKLCDVDVDECASHPCANGGLCIDSHADYYCACPFGYTGKSCESKIELCTDNPCTNNALCMMESRLWRCYCVPDFHGEKCQYQYDECLLGPRCMNGGTCIDGVDNFTCSCPPRLTGQLCECLILDSGKLNCQYVSPTPNTLVVTTVTRPTSTNTTKYSITSTISTVYTSSEDPTTITNVPTTPRDQSVYTTYKNQFTSMSSTDAYYELTSRSTASTANGKTSGDLTPSDSTYNNVTTTPSRSTDATTYRTTDYLHYETTTMSYFTTRGDDTKSTTMESQGYTPTIIHISKTDLTTEEKTEATTTDRGATTKPATSPITSATTEESTPSTTFIYSTERSSPSTSEGPRLNVTKKPTNASAVSSTETSSTDLTTHLDEITHTTETPHLFTTPHPTIWNASDVITFLTSESYGTTSTESSDCFEITCFNGGTCIHSTEGAKCVCKFDYDGPYCEDRVGITSAAFSGDSYLTHKLTSKSGINVQLKARTLSNDGLILFANIGPDTYMCLYMNKGLLKFKFSCGYQTMLLSELEMPINNGYELKIKAVLDFIDGRKHCNASLHINDTLAMSGGQQVARPYDSMSRDSWLHLGAIPESFELDNISPNNIQPFTGCMFSLQIDGKPRYIFKDANDGFEVKECSSLACLSNPCYNGGTCDEIGEQWVCRCANGYLGRFCQDSVCATNPCQYGGTCVEHPGSGFLCLCPLGKHGLYCEHNLEISQLSFSAMVSGLSSYAVYQLPQNLVSNGIEIQFRIQPNNMDQISLLAFLGQSGPHDPKSDHLAVTFVKGYIMLTWNLGNGPRRIFTSRPLNPRSNKPHLIKIGRTGRTAWLAVDNTQNITGNAPGNLLTLDVAPYLYIGGHESANFSTLPHDLPLHGGFSGCIWDLWAGMIGTKSSNVVNFTPIRGRAVGQCSVTQCHPMICHNSGACLHHAATYSCLCPQGWFGPLCTSQQNPCDILSNRCAKDSTCVPTQRGYQCDCPRGKSGRFCENDIGISDVSFSGIRSYVKLQTMTLGDIHFSLEFEVKPLHPKGILFYTETHDGCFISLSLQGGLLEYRWTGIEWGGKTFGNQVVAVVRSGVVLSLGAWHTVKAGRYGRKLFLWVDGTMTTESLNTHQFYTTFNTSVYIGGIKDLSTLPVDVISGHAMSFTGCIRKVIINGQRYPLNKDHISESRNIDDCDGDVCGGDVCWNGGTCVISNKYGNKTADCVCEAPYTGPQCTLKIPCKPGECNKGKCIKDTCICPTGWEGYYCQNQIKIGTPQFAGNSYMVIDERKLNHISEKQTKSNKLRYKRNTNYISMNFTTAKPDGLLLWAEMNDKKHISVGLENGYLKMSWTVPKIVWRSRVQNRTTWSAQTVLDTDTVKLLQAGRISNGEWHTLQFRLRSGNVTIVTDDKLVYEENSLDFDMADGDDMVLYLGGFPNGDVSTSNHSKGLYASNFVGCIDELSFGAERRRSITNFSDFESENVEMCQLFV